MRFSATINFARTSRGRIGGPGICAVVAAAPSRILPRTLLPVEEPYVLAPSVGCATGDLRKR